MALVSFNLPIARGNKIHCLDILHALVKHVLGHVEETDDFKKVTSNGISTDSSLATEGASSFPLGFPKEKVSFSLATVFDVLRYIAR